MLTILELVRGTSIFIMMVVSAAYALIFFWRLVTKAHLGTDLDHGVDKRTVALFLAFLSISFSYSEGSLRFILILTETPLPPLEWQVWLYAWGPVVASWSFIMFSVSFWDKEKGIILILLSGLLGLTFILLVYPSPLEHIIVTKQGEFYETDFTGIASVLLSSLISSAIVILVSIFGHTALRANELRVRVRSGFIALGGSLFGISGILDLLASSTPDLTVLLLIRTFSLFSLTVLFLGFFYPKKLEKYLLSKFDTRSTQFTKAG